MEDLNCTRAEEGTFAYSVHPICHILKNHSHPVLNTEFENLCKVVFSSDDDVQALMTIVSLSLVCLTVRGLGAGVAQV